MVSTPGVQLRSGVAGGFAAQFGGTGADRPSSDHNQSDGRRAVDQHGSVPIAKNEPIAINPIGVGRVMTQVSVPQCHRRFPAIPIGIPGWPELASWTASIDKARMALASSLEEEEKICGIKWQPLQFLEERTHGYFPEGIWIENAPHSKSVGLIQYISQVYFVYIYTYIVLLSTKIVSIDQCSEPGK